MIKKPLTVTVFGAASDKISDDVKYQAFEVGKLIGHEGHMLVYGAGSTGVMGAVARGYLSSHPSFRPFGSTTRYITDLEDSMSEDQINLIVTRTMSQRKEIYWFADICLVMPGGLGTLDELFEFATMKKLDQWTGRILVWEEGWLADTLKKLFKDMKKQGFVSDIADIEWVNYDKLSRILYAVH